MYPILSLSFSGLIMLFLGLSKKGSYLLYMQFISLLVALGSLLIDWNASGLYFNDMIAITNSTLMIQGVLILTTLLVSAFSAGQFDDQNAHPAEYFSLMQFCLAGGLIMVSFNNFIMLFIGLEILSVGLYVLTGTDKRNLRGNEAAVKYFLMGAFATGIMLFGIAMLYGATGSFSVETGFNFKSIDYSLMDQKVYYILGIVFFSIGLLFKISAVPFHFWTADVYQGAPTIFTSFMAALVKSAGILTIYKVFTITFGLDAYMWSKYLIVIIVLSILVGNVSALWQENFKRTMAFSSISQAGFLLLSILGMSKFSETNLIFYSLSYSMAIVSAFGVFMIVRANKIENGQQSDNMDVFQGLFQKSPFLAIVLMIAMLSMAGIPLTSGFWSKYFVLTDAASKGNVWLLVYGGVLSAISLYYYFKPIRASFATAQIGVDFEVNSWSRIALGISTILTILLGIAPNLLRGLLS
ncbi:MAG: NADH-quinone oxidoreductase subunit N [Leadbetterella sp.]